MGVALRCGAEELRLSRRARAAAEATALAEAPGNVRLEETKRDPREGGRCALPAGRGRDARRTGGRQRGARTREKGRAHLLARGAPLPRPAARTRPRLPSRHGPRNPAHEALDGRARRNCRRLGLTRARLARSAGEGDLAFFRSSQCQSEPRLALRRLHG